MPKWGDYEISAEIQLWVSADAVTDRYGHKIVVCEFEFVVVSHRRNAFIFESKFK